MTVVAGLVANHIARHGHRCSVGHEIQGRGRIVGTHIERRQVAAPVNGHGVCRGRIESAGRFRLECISVIAVGVGAEGSTGISRGLNCRGAAAHCRNSACSIRRVLLLPVWNSCRNHTHGYRSGRVHSSPVERKALGIGDQDPGRDCSIFRDGGARDFENQPRPYEVDYGCISVVCLFVFGERVFACALQTDRTGQHRDY